MESQLNTVNIEIKKLEDEVSNASAREENAAEEHNSLSTQLALKEQELSKEKR